MIAHPRSGHYVLGFVTGNVVVHTAARGANQYCTVFVPTNHVYLGDVFMIPREDVMQTDLSVQRGLEIVISCGMAVPAGITAKRAGEGEGGLVEGGVAGVVGAFSP